MHLCPENWKAIGRAVVYYAWAAHAFSTGIKCRHCMVNKNTSTQTAEGKFPLHYTS